MSGEEACEESHSGAGVSAVDGGGGGCEFHRLAVDAEVDGAVSGEFVDDFDFCAEGAHGVEGVDAVFAGEEVAEGADAVGEAAEDGGAV